VYGDAVAIDDNKQEARCHLSRSALDARAGRLTRKGGHCEVLMGFVGVGVGGGRVSLLLVMRIGDGDGEKKRRGACEVMVKRAMDAPLGAMTLPGTDRGEVVAVAL
jgi:hypothetical protein